MRKVRDTRVAKITGRTVGATAKDASLVPDLSGGNSQLYVPVVSSSGKVLMPTSNWHADELIAKGIGRY